MVISVQSGAWQRRLLKVLVSLLGMLLTWAALLAQQPLHYNITTDNGLPSNEVFEIEQDSFGHVWIGCNTGLYRYDGVRFLRYGSSREMSRAMSRMHIDPQGRLWCGNVAGQYFVRLGDTLRQIFSHDPNAVFEFVSIGEEGDLLVLEQQSLRRINALGKVVRKWTLPWPWKSGGLPTDMRWMGNDAFFSTADGGLFRLDLGQSRLYRMSRSNAEKTAGPSLFSTKGSPLYAKALRNSDGQASLQLPVGNEMRGIYAEAHPLDVWLRIQVIDSNKVWLCMQSGAKELRFEGGKWLAGPTLVPGAQVSAVMRDREGNLWFSSINKGLFMIPSAGAMRYGSGDDPLYQANVTAMATLPDGTVLAGNALGEVYALDLRQGLSQLVLKTSPLARAVKRIRVLPGGAFVLRSENTFLDWPSRKLRPFRLGSARDGIVDEDSVRLIGTSLGWTYPLKGWESMDAAPSRRLVGGRVLEQELGTGLVYWGHNDGLFVRRPDGYVPVLYGERPILALGMAAVPLGVWVATLNQGLLLCRDGKVVRQIGELEGLPELTVRTLVVHDGKLIFSTDQYLCQMDPESNTLRKLSRSAGFNPTDINQLTVSADRIWLGTNTGIVSVPLDFGVEDSGPLPSVRIGRVMVGETEVGKEGAIVLPAGHGALRVTVEGVSFRSRGRFGFEHRIPTIDTSWQWTAAASNEIVFTALPAGEHRLEVRTVDEQGRRSEVPAVLRLEVAMPLHLRPLFVISMALLLVGITVGVVEWRNRIQHRKERLKTAYIASQLTALKAQMNPHFLFNALNSIQDLVLSKDIRNSNLYLSKFSTLMRRVLAASGQDWVSVGDEVEMLRLYLDLECLRFGEEFSYGIHVQGSENADVAQIPTLILQPFVENAIKHGLLHKKGAKRLDIDFVVSEVGCKVTITDNGVGRKRSAEIKARSGAGNHESFSTSATDRRLDLIRQMHGARVSLEIVDLEEGGEATGTQVVVMLPLA